MIFYVYGFCIYKWNGFNWNETKILKLIFHCRLERLQDTLKLLYDQYHFSPKALRELRDIAAALEEKVLKPTTLRGARWLPYVHRAINVRHLLVK